MKPEGIEGCERFLSPGKGRGVRATKPFRLGDLVFACPAYSYVLTVNERGSHCEFCFTRKEGLSKCGKCKQAYYCNVECQLHIRVLRSTLNNCRYDVAPLEGLDLS